MRKVTEMEDKWWWIDITIKVRAKSKEQAWERANSRANRLHAKGLIEVSSVSGIDDEDEGEIYTGECACEALNTWIDCCKCNKHVTSG